MIFFDFLLPLIYILSISYLLGIVLKKEFNKTLPLVFMGSVLILYIFGLIGILNVGYIALYAISAFSIILFIYNLIQNKRKKIKFAFDLPQSIIAFILLYCFIFIITINKQFCIWDELSHWGPMVKETLRLDKFYSESPIGFAHQDYPPAICLLESLWCKLSGGRYAEGLLFRSLIMFELSLFFPFFGNSDTVQTKKKKIINSIIFVCLIVAFNACAYLDKASVFSSVYEDAVLGLLFGYCMAIVATEEDLFDKFFTVNLIVTLSYYILVKQMSVFFVGMILLFLLFRIIKALREKKGVSKLRIFGFSCFPVIPCAFLLSWKIYIAAVGMAENATYKISDINPAMLWGIFRGTGGEPWQRETMFNFLRELLFGDGSRFGIPYVFECVLAVILLIITLYFGKEYIKKHTRAYLLAAVSISLVGYAAAMWMTFIFTFGPLDGPRLASFDRYMGTIIFAICAMLLMIWLYYDSKIRFSVKKKTLAVIIAVCLMSSSSVHYIVYPVFRDVNSYSVYESDAKLISENTEEESRIFIVDQGGDGFTFWTIQYLTMPRDFNFINLGDKDTEEAKMLTPDELKEELKKYEYLFIYNVDEFFVSNYCDELKLNINEDLTEKQLYKIENNSSGDGLSFEFICSKE